MNILITGATGFVGSAVLARLIKEPGVSTARLRADSKARPGETSTFLVDMAKVPDDGPAQFPTYDRHPVPEGFGPASGVLARAERATGRARHGSSAPSASRASSRSPVPTAAPHTSQSPRAR